MRSTRVLILIAVLAPLGAGQIMNGSFETGFNNWTVTDTTGNIFPLAVVGAGQSPGFGLFSSAPTDATMCAYHGWDASAPGQVVIEQDAFINNLSLVFDWRAGAELTTFCGACTQDRRFIVEIQPAGGGAPLQTTLIYTAMINTSVLDTGPQVGMVCMIPFVGSTVRIRFIWDVPESFTGPAAAQLDNVRLTSGAGSWQVNSANASLDMDGVQIGSAFASQGATTTVVAGETSTLTMASALFGNGHDIIVGIMPLVPAGFTTTGGQNVNMDPVDPTLTFIFGGNLPAFLPIPGSYSVPVLLNFQAGVSLQGFVADPSAFDGFTLTQAVRHNVVPCSNPENFDALGPGSVFPPGWNGSSAQAWQVASGPTTSVGTGPTVGAFSPPNYVYCETSSTGTGANFILDTCPFDITGLTNFTLDFRLSRLGATIGTLNVYQDDGTGTFPTLLMTYTGPEPNMLDWTPESLPFVPISAAPVRFRFDYTAGTSFTGDLALDDIAVN